MRNNPAISANAEDPEGVPISAIIFGGRRASTVPLVYESFDWAHGVYLGATMGSETTAAASGTVGVVRRDPMAMLPFCGYNMGDYFNHWLMMGRELKRAPRVFMVNWFRKDRDGSLLWPGYGENLRMLKWIVDRVRGRADARETPIGLLPKVDHLDLSGLDIPNGQLTEALAVKPREWVAELELQEKFFASIGETLPPELEVQLETVRTVIEAGRLFGDDLWNLASRTS